MDYRQHNTIGLDLSYTPLAIPFPNVLGGGVSYNFNRDWQLRLDYRTTDNAMDYSDLKVASVNEEIYGIKFRHFFGNSFNMTFGYERRATDAYLDLAAIDVSISGEPIRSEAYADMLHLSLANHWQVDNWSFGVEWLSISLPINGKVTQSTAEQVDNASGNVEVKQARVTLPELPGTPSAEVQEEIDALIPQEVKTEVQNEILESEDVLTWYPNL